MCGEHRTGRPYFAIVQGSSPHVRGAPHLMAELRGQSGIIPACAGSTVSWRIRRPPCRDHPRMCGEHVLGLEVAAAHEGSSPHVRGARVGFLPDQLEVGIIPACAGSTGLHAIRGCSLRDHPRMCGEHTTDDSFNLDHMGSSPHVRGAHCETCPSVFETGIIPACAGSTHSKPTTRSSIRDHPRMCGEHDTAVTT